MSNDILDRARMAHRDMQGRIEASKLSIFEKTISHAESLEERVEKAEAERDALRVIAKQSIDLIESVQNYRQSDDPTEENSMVMCEHEVFYFDVENARSVFNQ